ncbi:hypothetical protein FOZ61_007072 [Perkinsus olseni]|uniref:K Homology domain-containing protein n=1 Tax=Perkinsus olseni TaxID=32597 RepID=A0A7J6LAP7_PEROL|nr:hypothetical protein FOZ61_007072 [Perkinsus olseni]KAF4659653.1 hypothetical protein FOL46_006523 [Perkinsus olseni]
MPSFESPRHYSSAWQCCQGQRKRSRVDSVSEFTNAPKRQRASSVTAAAAAALAAAKGLVQAPCKPRLDRYGNPRGLGALAQEQIIAEMGDAAESFGEPHRPTSIIRQVVCHEDLIGMVIGCGGATVKRLESSTSCKIESRDIDGQPGFMTLSVIGDTQPEVDKCASLIEDIITSGRLTLKDSAVENTFSKEISLVVPGFVQAALLGPKGCVLRTIEQDSSTRIKLEKDCIADGIFDDQIIEQQYYGRLMTIKGADHVSLGLAFEYVAQVIVGKYPVRFAMQRFMSRFKTDVYQGLSVEDSLPYRRLPLEWLDYCLLCSDALEKEKDKLKRSEIVKYICEIREKYFITADLLKWGRINRKAIHSLAGHMTEALREACRKREAAASSVASKEAREIPVNDEAQLSDGTSSSTASS